MTSYKRIAAAAGLVLLGALASSRAENATLTLSTAETAVLDPANWDKSFPAQLYFDAVRPLLVRFPGAAEAIQAKLKEGLAVEKAELVLEWERQEGAGPERGRQGWGSEEAYKQNPGEWSALARGVLHPWRAVFSSPGAPPVTPTPPPPTRSSPAAGIGTRSAGGLTARTGWPLRASHCRCTRTARRPHLM